MNAYSPLAAMKRLEDAGLPRAQAEAIASEIDDGRNDLVTKDYMRDQLDAALDKQTIKMSVIMAAMLTLFSTVIGAIIAVFTR